MFFRRLPPHLVYALLCLPALGQKHVLSVLPEDPGPALARLAETLHRNERFYDSIGGLLGYQLKCLELIRAYGEGGEQAHLVAGQAHGCGQDPSTPEGAIKLSCELSFHVPAGPDLASAGSGPLEQALALAGLRSLPHLAEIYPLGGAGDRLGLTDDVTGECLPAAMLPYCGRTLLEVLLRDLEAREYLFFRVFGQHHRTPVALMTSDAKGNHRRVMAQLESAKFYGRGSSCFRPFRQPLVPCVGAEDGRWPLPAPLQPMMKPGGHGAIWKLMMDEGVFDWLQGDCRREAALIRQISNPMAGTDSTLLALAGAGHPAGKTFGFASCERAVGAAEGVNVMLEKRIELLDAATGAVSTSYSYGVSNVEYTEFERLGISDQGQGDCSTSGSTLSVYPANTNILYVNLQRIRSAVEEGMRAGGGAVLPGLLFNTSKTVTYADAADGGQEKSIQAGRLECTMQNIADHLTLSFPLPLPADQHGSALDSFVLFNLRRKTTSSAKKKRKPGSLCIHQTPDGSFFDLMRNAEEILGRCRVRTPGVGAVEEYLARGPGFTFTFHPALGPLWSVIQQKLKGGALLQGAEVQLECAEVLWRDVTVDGSLRVEADTPLGPLDPASGLRSFSDAAGRVRLERVRVLNQGIDRSDPAANVWWRGKVVRREQCQVLLQGRSEFEARDVTLEGDCSFTVPDGYRMIVSPGVASAEGDVGYRVDLVRLPADQPPSWSWRYAAATTEQIQHGSPAILLQLHESHESCHD